MKVEHEFKMNESSRYKKVYLELTTASQKCFFGFDIFIISLKFVTNYNIFALKH